jgi:DNA processing protein
VRLPFDPDDELLARAAWSRIAEPGDAHAGRLVAEAGPSEALRHVLRGGGAPRWQARLADLDPAADLRALTRRGGRLLGPADPEWPAALADLGESAPLCLWVIGPLSLAAATARAVAVVGARAATDYGVRVAEGLGDGLADRGVTVVSGAAYGIDGAAHRGALLAGGPTVAVLACGVDRCYPRGHDRLLGRIGAEGVMISEVPPGSAPTRWRFIERNRVIACLGAATVVVEAAHRSGAMSTASRATRLNRPVAAVPGSVLSPLSYGCHRLLREGAVCVTSVEEVIELVAPVGEGLAVRPPLPSAPHDRLPPADLRVFDALPLGRGAGVDALVRVAGLEESAVLAALGRLEVGGLAVRDAGRWRRAGPPGA